MTIASPAPKSLAHIYQRLNELLSQRKQPGDIESHNLRKELEEAVPAQPAPAYTALAIWAAVINNECLMRDYIRKAMQYTGEEILMHFNFGQLLMYFGYPEEAAVQFTEALHSRQDPRPYLDGIAYCAMILEDPDLSQLVLQTSNRLEINGGNILCLAKLITAENHASEEEIPEIMDNILPDSVIQAQSICITDEKWQETMDFAKELEKYL